MHISEVVHNRWVQLASIGIVSATAGAGAGYILAKKRYEVSIERILEDEQLTFEPYPLEDGQTPEELGGWVTKTVITDDEWPDQVIVKEADPEFEALLKEDEDVGDTLDSTESEDPDEEGEDPEETPGETSPETEEPEDEDEMRDRIRELLEENSTDPEDPEALVTTNIFNHGEWDWDQELANRDPSAPYVIHQDEFVRDEKGYTQSTLTYYSSDQILADEQDKPVYNHAEVVGEMKFGHGSSGDSIVYIRNDRLHAEYEILLDDGSFEIEVLGFEAAEEEVQHSGLYRFRDSD